MMAETWLLQLQLRQRALVRRQLGACRIRPALVELASDLVALVGRIARLTCTRLSSVCWERLE